ncbi:MAG: hypothetical protein WC069_00690 [Candidatus Shapirobacteria bacterium]
MKTISLDSINKAEKFIKENCRTIEQARFAYLFKDESPDLVIDELTKYQNKDGGFGNGLEPDFMLPDSSPLATSLAFQFLDEITSPNEEVIKKAVKYLEDSYVDERHGWYSIPQQVNNYPHAVWWNWDETKKQTVIDGCWGNPSAEIIGYLFKYKKFLTKLNIDELVEYAVSYWEKAIEFNSEHEVFCFIRLHKYLPAEMAKRLEPKLIEATIKLVALNPEMWKEYSPQPIHFADNPSHFLYSVVKETVETNLDYVIDTISGDGVWYPNWTWHQYETEWEKAKIRWVGILTIRNLKILSDFNRAYKTD